MNQPWTPDAILPNGDYQFSDDSAPLLTVQFHGELDSLLTNAERVEIGRTALGVAVKLLFNHGPGGVSSRPKMS